MRRRFFQKTNEWISLFFCREGWKSKEKQIRPFILGKIYNALIYLGAVHKLCRLNGGGVKIRQFLDDIVYLTFNWGNSKQSQFFEPVKTPSLS